MCSSLIWYTPLCPSTRFYLVRAVCSMGEWAHRMFLCTFTTRWPHLISTSEKVGLLYSRFRLLRGTGLRGFETGFETAFGTWIRTSTL